MAMAYRPQRNYHCLWWQDRTSLPCYIPPSNPIPNNVSPFWHTSPFLAACPCPRPLDPSSNRIRPLPYFLLEVIPISFPPVFLSSQSLWQLWASSPLYLTLLNITSPTTPSTCLATPHTTPYTRSSKGYSLVTPRFFPNDVLEPIFSNYEHQTLTLNHRANWASYGLRTINTWPLAYDKTCPILHWFVVS